MGTAADDDGRECQTGSQSHVPKRSAGELTHSTLVFSAQ